MIRRVLIGISLFVVAMAARPAHAQLPIPSFAVVGGVSSYDLSGTGTTAVGALRVDIPLLLLLAEGSLGVMRPKEDAGTRTYIIPEAQLQYQLFPLLVRPYIGVGAGWFRAVSGPDPLRNDITLSASAGVRLSIPLLPVGLRAEARLRGIGSGFGSSATEFTLGASF
ncbi:MAG TPA: hypothetical protein VH277_00960 [Gemmatimonadaceae bacterium]|jgi:hypothetical protein|nr:hypothetical protein [Gemmatimonadaceae bacterium]